MLTIKGTVEQAETIIYDFCTDWNIANKQHRRHYLSLLKYRDKAQLERHKPGSRYQLYFGEDWIGLIEITPGKTVVSIEIRPFASLYNGFVERLAETFETWYKNIDAPENKKNGKKKAKNRLPWDDTSLKLEKLREIREESKAKGQIIGWVDACHLVGIDPGTARDHRPELRKNWYNKEF